MYKGVVRARAPVPRVLLPGVPPGQRDDAIIASKSAETSFCCHLRLLMAP